MYEYKAEVMRVIDGDTYQLRVDVGFDIDHKIHLRLKDVNAAEVNGVTKEDGMLATEYVKHLFAQHNNKVTIRTHFKRSFTRWVGEVFVDGIDLAAHLVAEGYAVIDKR